MADDNTLDRLVEVLGIETSYQDALGESHILSADTARAVIQAMGIAVDRKTDRVASLSAIEQARWLRTIDPTVLIQAGPDLRPTITFSNSAALADAPIAWTLTEEGGEVRRGTLVPSRLPLVDRRRIDALDIERRMLSFAPDLPLGYHRLELDGRSPAILGGRQALVIRAPTQCYLPQEPEDGPGIWGVACQVYALNGNGWGVGDLGDLASLVDVVAARGAGLLAINPLHALLSGEPARISPYSPSSRAFLNVLYIDVELVPEFAMSGRARALYESLAFRRQLEDLRDRTLVDYVGVAALKLQMLEVLYEVFRTESIDGGGRCAAFSRFRDDHGAALGLFATHEALAEHYGTDSAGRIPWHQWPLPFRDPESPAVAQFARAHPGRVEFHQYLQWEADRQLAAVATRAAGHGMSVGLYRDMALGIDPDGADAWAYQRSLTTGVALGAPPDSFNVDGQNWGLPPINPLTLRKDGFRLFIRSLRSNMRHAGAIRIDHIMGFQRQFWIPSGMTGAGGAYIGSPLEEIIAITALESHRARCVVVGEDLGTVPDGLRARLRAARILSSRLLYFERQSDGAFKMPGRYPRLSHVAVGTHDLPTLPGYWRARDIDVRAGLHLYPSPEAERTDRAERARMRVALIEALIRAGLWPTGEDPPVIATPALLDAVYAFLASSPGLLLMVQIEDALGIEDQINLPGTVDEYPNWRRKLPIDLEHLVSDGRLANLAQAIVALRPGHPDAGASVAT